MKSKKCFKVDNTSKERAKKDMYLIMPSEKSKWTYFGTMKNGIMGQENGTEGVLDTNHTHTHRDIV